MQIIFVKLTLYVSENVKKNTVLIPGKPPLKLKNTPKTETKTIAIPYLLQAQLVLALLLRFYNNVQTAWQTDLLGAG